MPISRQSEYSIKLRRQGLCSYCPTPAEIGKTLCQKHLNLRKAKRARETKHRKESGLCRSCGNPLNEDVTGVECVNCKDMRQTRRC